MMNRTIQVGTNFAIPELIASKNLTLNPKV